MNTAHVVVAGRSSHPESGRRCLCITVDRPWTQGGARYPMTNVWCDEAAPAPATGETVMWDHGHVWTGGARWRKVEMDSNADPAIVG